MSSDVLHLSPQQLVPLMPVLDALNDGMLIVDASGSVIAVNKAMRRLYQGGEVPYPGYPLSDFNAADWVEAKRVLTSGKPLLGQIMHLPAATVVASHLPIVHQGTVTGVVCAMQEIASLDDIVHKLQAYRELDAQLNGLLEALPQGVIVCDAKEHILRANTAGCRLCGREYGVVQGGSLEEVCRYGMTKDCGLLVNSSRGIIYADSGESFATAAAEKARELQAAMAGELAQL